MTGQWLFGSVELGHVSPWNEVIAERHASATERMHSISSWEKGVSSALSVMLRTPITSSRVWSEVVSKGVWTWAEICQGIESTEVCKANM